MQNQAAEHESSKYLPVHHDFCQLLGISSPTGYKEVVLTKKFISEVLYSMILNKIDSPCKVH